MSSTTLVNVKVTLDRWFEDQCASRRMNKQDVADAIGVSGNRLGRALNNPEKADAEIIYGLARVFEVGDWPTVLVEEFGFGHDSLTKKEWNLLGKHIGLKMVYTQSVAA